MNWCHCLPSNSKTFSHILFVSCSSQLLSPALMISNLKSKSAVSVLITFLLREGCLWREFSFRFCISWNWLCSAPISVWHQCIFRLKKIGIWSSCRVFFYLGNIEYNHLGWLVTYLDSSSVGSVVMTPPHVFVMSLFCIRPLPMFAEICTIKNVCRICDPSMKANTSYIIHK